ncbi:MAG TPA: transcriptional repressor LexA [Fimbriimonadales bacterium]|jgi:repressor LexA|nr:transcriptional repressor LexA [Fimbriimonadales bacterium]
MTKGLTQRQEAVLQFVLDYLQESGYPPSIREIGKHFQIDSLRGVTVHLDALARKGYIARGKTPRSIQITHPAYRPGNNVKMVPLLGTIAAGTPILAEGNIEALMPVPAEMVRNISSAFLLRVRGDSMNGEGILPRDLVVIRPQETANNGDLVAALIGDEATVKRIRYSPSGIRLMASNPNYEPILIKQENAKIIGKVVGLLRDYEGMAF